MNNVMPKPWREVRDGSEIEMCTDDWMQDEIDGLRRFVDVLVVSPDAKRLEWLMNKTGWTREAIDAKLVSTPQVKS